MSFGNSQQSSNTKAKCLSFKALRQPTLAAPEDNIPAKAGGNPSLMTYKQSFLPWLSVTDNSEADGQLTSREKAKFQE